MKQSILVFSILVFSLISGAIWAYGVLEFFPQYLSSTQSESKNETSLASQEIENKAPKKTQSLSDFESSLVQTVKQVSPSVVSIIIQKDIVVYRSDPWGFFQQAAGSVKRQVWGGSGFFIKKDGTILTNKHVVSDPNAEYTVILNSWEEYPARVLALDPINDLAVIKIDSQKADFQALELIDNINEVSIWDFSIAVGNALAEFQNSVSLGIVSGKDRSIEAQWSSLSGLIQTDAAINPGNSGGPLISLNGKVIGINTAIISGSNGIGFAFGLTQDRVNYVLESIEKHGRILRPFIGINYIQNSPGVAQKLGLSVNYGAYIIDEAESIVKGSSAQKVGIEPGDIILSVDGKQITPSYTLAALTQTSLPGDRLKVEVLKKSGTQEELELELGEY